MICCINQVSLWWWDLEKINIKCYAPYLEFVGKQHFKQDVVFEVISTRQAWHEISQNHPILTKELYLKAEARLLIDSRNAVCLTRPPCTTDTSHREYDPISWIPQLIAHRFNNPETDLKRQRNGVTLQTQVHQITMKNISHKKKTRSESTSNTSCRWENGKMFEALVCSVHSNDIVDGRIKVCLNFQKRLHVFSFSDWGNL